MAAPSGYSKMKRLESKKSHSWWWDSHISPKNSKWLAENLQEMDQNVKKMLKLIEEDGDSFAKKAEMYYQKRPELVSQVEEFYRMYRALAERYDLLTGELRKNIPESPSPSSSDSESDVTSDHHRVLQTKIADLEIELREVKDKLRSQEEEVSGDSGKYEQKQRLAKEETNRLNIELKKFTESEERLLAEIERLNSERDELESGVRSRDDRIDEMEKHLNQLHMQHVELIIGAEEARKLVGELRSRAKQLEDVIQKQRVVILGLEGGDDD